VVGESVEDVGDIGVADQHADSPVESAPGEPGRAALVNRFITGLQSSFRRKPESSGLMDAGSSPA
jgi:hypothetical protein